jgi:hypothetical protein
MRRDGGVNFASSPSTRARSSCACSTPLAARTAALPAARGRADGVLARLSARRRAGPGLRPARARPLPARARPPLQPAQAAARPLGARDRRPLRLADRGAHGYELGHPDGARSFDTRDNATVALKARVAAPDRAAPRARRARAAPRASVVLYEAARQGLQHALPGIPAALRGTYAGWRIRRHRALQRLGVTTLSLLPVHYRARRAALVRRRAWSTTGATTRSASSARSRATDARRAPAPARAASSAPWSTPCTPPASRWCSTWSTTTPPRATRRAHAVLRGLDNARLVPADARRPQPLRELDRLRQHAQPGHPRVTQFVLDSLRYWVQEMGVDGFRFDLATGAGPHAPRLRRPCGRSSPRCARTRAGRRCT